MHHLMEMVPAARDTPRAYGNQSLVEPRHNSHFWLSAATMGVAISFFAYGGIAYNMIFLARVLPAVGKFFWITPMFVIFNVFWGLAVWSYLQAHSRDPGVVPREWHEFVRSVGQTLPIVPARSEWQPGKATFCKKCVRARPERAHHCQICGICVLRMDHHCPWINNCVGFRNYKFFILLAIYADLACVFALASSFPELVSCLVSLANRQNDFRWEPYDALSPADIIGFLAMGMLIVFIAAVITHMLSVHLPLACRNITSIEDFYENMENPFETGSIAANLSQVFGDPGLDWLIPITPTRLPTDGICFVPTSEERLSLAHKGPDIFMVGDLGSQERTWRWRYNVRPQAADPIIEDFCTEAPTSFWGCTKEGHKTILRDFQR